MDPDMKLGRTAHEGASRDSVIPKELDSEAKIQKYQDKKY